jgi:hypothetical protein
VQKDAKRREKMQKLKCSFPDVAIKDSFKELREQSQGQAAIASLYVQSDWCH